jgi:anti-sigma-K factor RskA
MNPQLEELACLYVLDRLEPRERASFEASLRHDPQLASFVSELESTLDQRIRALPPVEPPSGLLAQIEERIDLDSIAGTSAPRGRERERVDLEATSKCLINELPAEIADPDMGRSQPSPEATAGRRPASPWISIARWGIAALIAIGVGTIAVWQLRRAPAVAGRPFVIVVGLDSRRSAMAELPVQKSAMNSDASFVQLATLAEQYWDKPENLPGKLHSAGEGGRGYALYDPASSQGFIAVQQLPVIGHGQRYHLWMLDSSTGRIREAGILPLEDSSRGLYFFSVAPTSEAKPGRVDFFVTAEDAAAPESTRPTGKIVLGGQRTF